jgi:ketosteroid isomerase-like protein
MRPICIAALTIIGGVPFFAQLKTNPAKADMTSVEQTLIQLERDWNQATIAKDYKTLERIMGDDWIGIDYLGITVTKAETIAEIKFGESSNKSVELGEMKVRVFGGTAVVTGTDTEKSTYHGKDSSGNYAWMDYAWMDVFVKRNGRWQAVASESTKLGK